MADTQDAALTKPNQLKAHAAGALANGCGTAVYAGVPSGVEAFNAAAEVLAHHTKSPP